MTDLETRWAWSQIEAMADGSLSSGDTRRMRAAIASDPALREAVEHAAQLRAALRGQPRDTAPASLVLALLRIPSGLRPARRRALAAAAAIASLAFVTVLVLVTRPAPPPPSDARAAAVEEFELAMAYLQRSAVLARTEATNAVGEGLQGALAAGREALRNGPTDFQNGDEDDAN